MKDGGAAERLTRPHREAWEEIWSWPAYLWRRRAATRLLPVHLPHRSCRTLSQSLSDTSPHLQIEQEGEVVCLACVTVYVLLRWNYSMVIAGSPSGLSCNLTGIPSASLLNTLHLSWIPSWSVTNSHTIGWPADADCNRKKQNTAHHKTSFFLLLLNHISFTAFMLLNNMSWPFVTLATDGFIYTMFLAKPDWLWYNGSWQMDKLT